MFLVQTGSQHVGQAGLERLTSSDPSASASLKLIYFISGYIVCRGSDLIPYTFEVNENEVTHVIEVSTVAGSTSKS